MELQRIEGGLDHTRGAPLPLDVARHLSYLAHLIDDTIELRGVGIGTREFAAAFLRIPLTDVVITSAGFRPMAFALAALAFAEDLETHEPAAVIGMDQEEPPQWTALDLGDTSPRIPIALGAAFGAGALLPCAIVVAVHKDYQDNLGISAYTAAADARAGQGYLDDLRARGRARTNPFRNRTLESTWHPHLGLWFRVATPAAASRDDVVLPAAIWRDVDRNVHGLFAALERLRAAGLSCNRGVLLAGPPGTGKTALCRVLAAELAGHVTVVFCDASSIGSSIRELYRELEHLAPALVVIEDIDLVVGHRHQGGGQALVEFLLALDGAMSGHRGVVTVATTNDLAAIDPAARRSARFDQVIDVPPPDERARAAILARYLGGHAPAVDLARIARATSGFTGADLRELVSSAVLHVAEADRIGEGLALDTDLLFALARASRRAAPAGQYL
jgi:hypothetical protein